MQHYIQNVLTIQESTIKYKHAPNQTNKVFGAPQGPQILSSINIITYERKLIWGEKHTSIVFNPGNLPSLNFHIPKLCSLTTMHFQPPLWLVADISCPYRFGESFKRKQPNKPTLGLQTQCWAAVFITSRCRETGNLGTQAHLGIQSWETELPSLRLSVM